MGGVHIVSTRGLFGDSDPMGVMYYANYLRLFELGRAELMRAAGCPYSSLAARGIHLPVTEALVRYRRPIPYDEPVQVRTTVAWIKRASLQFSYELFLQGDVLAASGHTIHACVQASGRLRRLPRELLKALEAYGPQRG